MMRYCGSCGAVLRKESLYCPECGVKLYNRSRWERIKRMQTRLLRSMDETWRFEEEDIGENRLASFFAYLPLGGIISRFLSKTSPFARFHRAQGWRLLLPEAILLALGLLLTALSDFLFPSLTRPIRVLLMIPGAVLLALLIAGCVISFKGKAVRLPFIGKKEK